MRWLVALVAALAVPLGTAAQGFSLQPPPSIGEAIDQIELLRERQRGVDQTFVVPERPGQNQVAWFDFDWKRYDVPPPGGGPGGIRLYFYKRERQVAERALPVIRSAYARLVEAFHYSPTKKIPYILYSSHREFQTTNVFEVSESVLGVTSPKDLKMSLPYFGDHELFREVSTHEMVHQFQIQKLLDVAGAEEMASPIESLPLWFIEGMAEYYAKGGLDIETEMFLRDLVWNPDPEHHYQIVSFPEDRYRGYIPTYKLGQARIAFIADVYGKEKLQAYLENAYLVGGTMTVAANERNFTALTKRVLNDTMEHVDARWREWLKRRYYPEYLQTRQDISLVRDIVELPAEVESYASTTDGNAILYRGLDRERGRARVYLFDPRDPRGAVEVASDDVPGVESLHPIEHGILAISDDLIVFAAQDGPGDTIYVQRYRHDPPGPKGKPPRVKLGSRHRIKLVHPGGLRFIEISDPALSADGKQLAFVGLTETGQQDIYVVPIEGGTARQLTDDPFTEKDLAWGADGIYCSSDATDHGRLNLFRIDPNTGARARLTTAPANDRHPRPQPDGSVFYSSDSSGKPDLYVLDGRGIRKLTDFATGLQSPSPSPTGRGLYATTFYRGRFRLVEVPKVAWLGQPPVAVASAAGPVLEVPIDSIPEDIPGYTAWGSWRPETGVVYGGGATNAVAGRAAVLFSDLLRDHILYLDLAVYGSFDYTQGLALYEDRSRRTAWALGAFHFVQQQLDRMDPNLAYFQRDFGATGVLRYPLDRFRRVEAEMSLGAVQRYCLTDYGPTNTIQLVPLCNGLQTSTAYASTTDWDQRNGGVSPTFNPTFRYGYDTVRYDLYAGPIEGSALLLELGGAFLPTRHAVTGFFRTDAVRYWPIIGRSKFFLRGAAGTSFAPDDNSRLWARSWWLTSGDNLRGFYPLDLAYLVGLNYYVVNAELQIPLDPLIHLFIFDYIAGVAAVDFGGVFNRWSNLYGNVCDNTGCHYGIVQPGAWYARTLTGVLGVNVLFGPLLLRVHFGHPINIGGQLTPAMKAGTSWVTNVTLRYFFF